MVLKLHVFVQIMQEFSHEMQMNYTWTWVQTAWHIRPKVHNKILNIKHSFIIILNVSLLLY